MNGTRIPPSVRSPFAPTKGQLRDHRSPPLSERKAHDRVVGLAGCVERVEHSTDAGVHRFDQLAVLGQRPVVPVEQRVGVRFVLGLELRPDTRSDIGVAGPFPRPVGGGVVELEMEGLVALDGNELGGAVRDHPGEVADLLHRGVVLPQVGHAEGADVFEVVDGTVEASEESLVSGLHRAVPGEPSAVPLAEHGGVVAGVDEQRRERGVIVGNAHSVGTRPQRLLDPGGDAPGIAARVQADAGGRTPGRTGVGVGEAHALGREAIEIRRRDLGGSEAAEIGPSEVVGQNEDHVGRGGGAARSPALEPTFVANGMLVVGHRSS